MRTFQKSSKLDNVCYDVRGPVLDEANRMQESGIDILKLNIGNPAPFGFSAPEEVILDMIYTLRESQGYSDSKGIFAARKAIMQYCQLKKIPNVSINDIYTGNGVSELINMAMQGLVDSGDEILVPSPDYPLWTGCVTLAGGKAVHYICDEQSEWYPDVEDIKSKITDKTKAIVLINPNNPTGAVYPKEVLQKICRCGKRTRTDDFFRRDLRPSGYGRHYPYLHCVSGAGFVLRNLKRTFQISYDCRFPLRLDGVKRGKGKGKGIHRGLKYAFQYAPVFQCAGPGSGADGSWRLSECERISGAGRQNL